MWKIKIHKEAKKFLEKLEESLRERILSKLNTFIKYLNEGVFPIKQFDIKKLKGEWKDFFRMRIERIRVMFYVAIEIK